MRVFKKTVITFTITLFFGFISCDLSNDKTPPNIIFVLTDDLGFNDLSSYGSTIINTPNLDKLANQGALLNSYYSTQAVCSASRASILTGSYSNRIGFSGALGPNSKTGINPNELLLSEMLKESGYKTAIYGKWHLGDNEKFLPTRHGFDDFYGILYSNDMWPYHPERPDSYPELMLYENENPIEVLTDQSNLTMDITSKSVKFINENKENPFFLYIAHPQPHVPLFASSKFNGRSENGLYADVIEEIDYSIEKVMEALKENNLDKNTIVVFTSDHGYHLGEHGHWQKQTLFEDGTRVPLIIAGPGIKNNKEIINNPVELVDLYPTIMDLVQMQTPKFVSGKSIVPLLENSENIVRESALTELQINTGNGIAQGYSIKTKRYRLSQWEHKGIKDYELYDHFSDTSELTNLSEYLDYQKIRDSLVKILDIRILNAKKVPLGLGRQITNAKPWLEPKIIRSKPK